MKKHITTQAQLTRVKNQIVGELNSISSIFPHGGDEYMVKEDKSEGVYRLSYVPKKPYDCFYSAHIEELISRMKKFTDKYERCYFLFSTHPILLEKPDYDGSHFHNNPSFEIVISMSKEA